MVQDTDKPEGPEGYDGIPQSAVDPPIKHGIKWRIPHRVEIGLDHFPGEVQKE